MPLTCLIGELLNSSRPKARRIFETRDEAALVELAREQVRGGATFIDLNASMLMKEEREALRWAARCVASAVDAGVSLDSPSADVLLDVLRSIEGNVILNSFAGDDAHLQSAFAAARDRGAGLIVMLKSGAGIPATAEGRIALAEDAFTAAHEAGVPPERLYFDPLITPLATARGGMRTALDTIQSLKARFPSAHRIGGLSNCSFGLPMRRLLNRTLLAMAVRDGLDSMICDTTDAELIESLAAAEALAGMDEGCRRFLAFYRERTRRDR